MEFLIWDSGECVSAESRFFVDEGHSRTSDYRITLGASFMSAEELEALLECISLPEG